MDAEERVVPGCVEGAEVVHTTGRVEMSTSIDGVGSGESRLVFALASKYRLSYCVMKYS